MVHNYYVGARILSFAVSVPVTLLFVLQIYWDRRRYEQLIHPRPRGDGRKAKTKPLFRWPTKAILRILGLLISVVTVFLAIDARGVFGIYSEAALRGLTLILTLLTTTTLGFAFYRSVLAAFPTKLAKYANLKKRLKLCSVIYVVGATILQVSNELVTDRVGIIVIAVFTLISSTFFAGALVIVVRELHQLRKFFELNPAQASDYGTCSHKQIVDRVKKWQRFALAVVILWVCLTIITVVFTIHDATISYGDDAERPAHHERFIADPSRPPDMGIFDPLAVEGLLARCILGVALWYTWISKTRAKTDADEFVARSVCCDDTVLANMNRKRANSGTHSRSTAGSCLRTVDSSCRVMESITRAPSPSRSTPFRRNVLNASTFTETTGAPSCYSGSPDFLRNGLGLASTPAPDNISVISHGAGGAESTSTSVATSVADRSPILASPKSRKRLLLSFTARNSDSMANCLDGLGRIGNTSNRSTPVPPQLMRDDSIPTGTHHHNHRHDFYIENAQRMRGESSGGFTPFRDSTASDPRGRSASNNSSGDRSDSSRESVVLTDDEKVIESPPSSSEGNIIDSLPSISRGVYMV